MRKYCLLIVLSLLPSVTVAQEVKSRQPATAGDLALVGTTACDSAGFLEAALAAEELRKTRRLSAAQCAQYASEPNTVVLDARGQLAFEHLHMRGSVNLPYTAFSEEALQKTIPSKATRVLIYCRNNLRSVGPERSITIDLNQDFGSTAAPTPDLELAYTKDAKAGLNIPTYITLYVYGYRDVWELGTVVDPNDSPIVFEGKAAPASK
jgi:hypothetical protein